PTGVFSPRHRIAIQIQIGIAQEDESLIGNRLLPVLPRFDLMTDHDEAPPLLAVPPNPALRPLAPEPIELPLELPLEAPRPPLLTDGDVDTGRPAAGVEVTPITERPPLPTMYCGV